MVRIKAHIDYSTEISENSSILISVVSIYRIFYHFHKKIWIFLTSSFFCILRFQKLHHSRITSVRNRLHLSFLQLNTFFISFPFFSSQFEGIIKVQTKTNASTPIDRRVNKYNTYLFHFFLSSFAIPASPTRTRGFCISRARCPGCHLENSVCTS